MKKLFAAALMLTFAVMMDAQTAIRNEKMTQDGTNVTVSFEVDTDNTDLPVRRKEVIMPYIYNGKDTRCGSLWQRKIQERKADQRHRRRQGLGTFRKPGDEEGRHISV